MEQNDIITSYEYNKNGSITKETTDGLETKYNYNGFNQLTQINKQDGSWQQNIYDPSGLRSAIVENGIYTNFINNGANAIAETDIHNNISKLNIRGYSLLATKDQVGRNYYYLQNTHTDVVGIIGQDGKMKNSYEYACVIIGRS
jgi:YD repeat-containing protein